MCVGGGGGGEDLTTILFSLPNHPRSKQFAQYTSGNVTLTIICLRLIAQLRSLHHSNMAISPTKLYLSRSLINLVRQALLL